MSELQRYKVVTFPHRDPRYEECVIVKADPDDTEGEIFTIETLEQEFEVLRKADPLGQEPVYEIAEGLIFRASGIVGEPRAERLLRVIDRLTIQMLGQRLYLHGAY